MKLEGRLFGQRKEQATNKRQTGEGNSDEQGYVYMIHLEENTTKLIMV